MKVLVALISLVLILVGCGSPGAALPNTPSGPSPAAANTIAPLTATQSPAPRPSPTSSAPLAFVSKFAAGDDPNASPVALALDKQGNIYVVEGFNRRILKLDGTGKLLAQWGKHGQGEGQFDFQHVPQALAVDDQGNVYVTDDGNGRVQKFDSSGKFLAQWGSQGSGEAQFTTPSGLVVDAQRNVYVSDLLNASVQKFDSSGKFLGQIGSRGTEDGQFRVPSSLALDGQGNLYVGEFSGVIQKFDTSGKFLAKFVVDSCRLIYTLTIDAQGNLYAADEVDPSAGKSDHAHICKFDSTGKTLAVWENKGSDDGQFIVVAGIAPDAQGNIYIADTNNHRIQKLRQH